jgi:hypothetical protein
MFRRQCSRFHLLQRAYPILDVIGGGELVVFHCENIDRHRVKTFACGLRSPKFPCRDAGGFTAHHDLITKGLNIFDCPNGCSNRLEFLSELIPANRFLIGVI